MVKIPVRWEFFANYDWDVVESKAIEMGWLEDKVQVKRYHDRDKEIYWTIEPYESECRCPNLVHSEDREKEKDVRRFIYPPPIR